MYHLYKPQNINGVGRRKANFWMFGWEKFMQKSHFKAGPGSVGKIPKGVDAESIEIFPEGKGT